MTTETAVTVTSATIFYDRQDPSNEGWAYNVITTDAGGFTQHDSGGLGAFTDRDTPLAELVQAFRAEGWSPALLAQLPADASEWTRTETDLGYEIAR